VYVTRECAAAIELQTEMDDEVGRRTRDSDEPLLDTGNLQILEFVDRDGEPNQIWLLRHEFVDVAEENRW
jgi:hypothetical protein